MTNAGWLGLFLIAVSLSIWAAQAHDLVYFLCSFLFAAWCFGNFSPLPPETPPAPPT